MTQAPFQQLRSWFPAGILPSLSAGVLMALVMLTFSASYGALVFSGLLAPYVGAGLVVALMSCGVVAFIVALGSSFTFAIGGPDSNAAAILAVAVGSLAVEANRAGGSPEATLLTVLAGIAVSSVLCGAILWGLGRARQGKLVRFIPYPVVGGFLAGTGYLLIDGTVFMLAGEGLGYGVLEALATMEPLVWVPPIAVAGALIAGQRLFRHFLVVPAVLLGAGILFFAVLWLEGQSVQAARQEGLLLWPLEAGAWRIPLAFEGASVHWDLVFGHMSEWLAMTAVVAITILLNATGLELATDHEVDFNRELKVAGTANVAAGLLGGMVGYLSLSRSLMNREAGAQGRAVGVSAAVLCLSIPFLFPAGVGYLPRPVLAGLPLYVGVELVIKWVFAERQRLPLFEYLLVLAILVLIAVKGFLAGTLLGVMIASLLFVFNYSRLNPVKHAFTGDQHLSNVERHPGQMRLLRERGEQVYCLALQGYVFFGTSNTILDEVRRRTEMLRFVLVDFRLVQGLDVSAVLSFVKLRQLCRTKGCRLVLTALQPHIRRVFDKAGFLLADAEVVRTFADLDRGLEWIENELLALDVNVLTTGESGMDPEDWEHLQVYLERAEVEAGSVVAARGAASDTLFFIESGQVSIYLDMSDGRPEKTGRDPVLRKRLRTYGAGTIVGEMGFYTAAERSADVVADAPTQILRLDQDKLALMESAEPQLAIKFHRFVVRLLAARLSAANREIETLL